MASLTCSVTSNGPNRMGFLAGAELIFRRRYGKGVVFLPVLNTFISVNLSLQQT
jgi:hypothetical protein